MDSGLAEAMVDIKFALGMAWVEDEGLDVEREGRSDFGVQLIDVK